jgi:hypothetical protein
MKAHHTSSVSFECPHCQTLFANVPVDADEDGLYAALEVTPCGICTALLCRCCPQFQCAGCDETFCRSHAVTLDGDRFCPGCAFDLPAAIPAQRETRSSTGMEVA